MELVQMVLIPALVGALTLVVMQWLKGGLAWIENQSALVKRVIVGVIAFGLAKLSTLSGIALPTDLSGLSGEVVQELLSWGAALLLHAVTKKVKPV